MPIPNTKFQTPIKEVERSIEDFMDLLIQSLLSEFNMQDLPLKVRVTGEDDDDGCEVTIKYSAATEKAMKKLLKPRKMTIRKFHAYLTEQIDLALLPTPSNVRH